jgi:hypothetical protein
MRVLVMTVVMRVRMVVCVGMSVLMTVVPQLGLVQQKEKNQAQQQGGEQHIGRDV